MATPNGVAISLYTGLILVIELIRERMLLSGLNVDPVVPTCTVAGSSEVRMSQVERFAHLLRELERVGVDPNTISAGLAVREEDVLRALAALPDGAGPSAFLSQLRMVMTHGAGAATDRHHDSPI
jgi:hypothetical protein